MTATAMPSADTSRLSKVLVISDWQETLGSISARLREEQAFEVLTADQKQTGLTIAQVEWPALVIIDLKDTAEVFQICQALRADRGTRGIAVIILSAANDIAARIAGLEAGADDYVGKPCNPREIVLRVKAVLRRGTRAVSEEHFLRGPIRVDPARCRVAVDNKQIHLTAVEFKLLRTLVKQPGQVQSRELLLSEARGNGELLESRTIDTHIRRLRRKLGKAAHLVETVRGSGYRLRPT